MGAIHVDGPDIDLACPRYYGSACHHVGHAEIDVAWTGPASLRVRASGPSLDLDWTVAVRETVGLGLMNRVGRSLPNWTWRPGPLVRAREFLARHLFGLGDLRLSGTRWHRTWGHGYAWCMLGLAYVGLMAAAVA